MKKDQVFLPGESQLVNTARVIKGTKIQLAMQLITYAHLPLSFESEGYIDRSYS